MPPKKPTKTTEPPGWGGAAGTSAESSGRAGHRVSTFIRRDRRGISRPWVIVSMLVFLAVELAMGAAVGSLVRWQPGHVLRLRVEMLLMLTSYFLGGLIVGFVSRGSRVDEPIIAAVLAVALSFCLTLFTPLRFFRFSIMRILLGSAIAAACAVLGVDVGAGGSAKLRSKRQAPESREGHRSPRGGCPRQRAVDAR